MILVEKAKLRSFGTNASVAVEERRFSAA